MHFYSIWRPADEPNYSTNVDLAYPYSDIPHQGNLNYLKIPVSSTDIVKHVDYWGEGRVVSGRGISGFPNSFNVNHQYRLVSSGPDKDKKIPNRIPLVSYDDCDTSAFIRDNSVLIVTVPRARLSSNCVRDIARMINDKRGNVVVYSKHGDSDDISELTAALKTKGLLLSENATLDCELLGLTYFDSHVAFITTGKNEKDINALKKDLANFLGKGDYDAAVYITQFLGAAVSEVVTKIISSAPQNVMVYAYKLWHSGNQDVVREHFPKPFQLIINKHMVRIINKEYNDTLSLVNYKESTEDYFVGGNLVKAEVFIELWKTPFMEFIPVYERGELVFLIKIIAVGEFIRIAEETHKSYGDLLCRASSVEKDDIRTDDSYRFLLKPLIEDDGEVLFLIISARNKYHLEMDDQKTDFGDPSGKTRLVRGHSGKIDKATNTFKWILDEVLLDPDV